MFNAHQYAITIEKSLPLPLHSADAIEQNPLEFLDVYLELAASQSEEKRIIVFEIDDKYSKYKGLNLNTWNEEDIKTFIQDIKRILPL